MFIAKYTIENEEKYALYYDNSYGWDVFYKDTFSPLTKDLTIIRLSIKGSCYQDKKEHLRDLAITWQHEFSYLSWSYSELAEIQGFFYTNGKRYGLLKEFKENAIC